MENKVKSSIVNVNSKMTDISSSSIGSVAFPIYNDRDSDCHHKAGVHSNKNKGVIAIDGFLGMKVKAENVDVDNTDKSHSIEILNETGILRNVINQSPGQIQIHETLSKSKIPLLHSLLSGPGPSSTPVTVPVPVPVQGRKWYCCPFCRDVRLLQEKRKNLRVFATSVGLILHVKQCHPDKQEDKIDVLQLEQSNTISNHFKKSCYTKSLTKLTLSSPRALLKQPSASAPVQVPVQVPVKTRKPNDKPSTLSTSTQAPKPKPRKPKSLIYKSTKYNSNRPPTQTPGPDPLPNIITINECSSQITKGVITQPFNHTLTSGGRTRTLKKTTTTAMISSFEVQNDECKENPIRMRVGTCKPNKPLGLAMVPLSLSQNCKSVITHRKVKKMDVGSRIWNRPVTVKASTLTTLESNITYDYSKAAETMNTSAENMDGDIIIEKVIVKPKASFHGHGVKKFSLDQVSNKSDADNVGLGSGNVNDGDAAEVLVKPIDFIDLTVEETESDSCSDSDCEEIIHISDDENEKKSEHPSEHSKRATAHRHIPFQTQQEPDPDPEPTLSPSHTNGISNELFNNGIASIQIQNVPDQTDQHQQASFVHAQPAVQVPDYAEEIEFEMGEHQPDSSSDDPDESVNDGSESEPMEYCISRRSPTSSASSNSEDLQVHPLDLDGCTVDLLYNQMHNMFPRLYDLDQLMATGTGD